MRVMFWRFFFSSRRRHTRWNCDWSSDVCSSDLSRERRGPGTVGRTARASSQNLHRPGYPWSTMATLRPDRKSTRLNSSHSSISYAVFCLKKKKKKKKNKQNKHKTNNQKTKLTQTNTTITLITI